MAGRRGVVALAALAGLSTLWLGGGTTEAAFNTAAVANPDSSAGTGQVRGQHVYAGHNCTGGGPGVTTCPGNPAWTARATNQDQVVTDAFTNSSSGAVGATFTHQVRVDSCAPSQFADSRGGTANPMLPRNNVVRQVPDKWGTTSAARFDGVDDYAADVVSTTTSAQNAASYSIGVWFRAAPASPGGGLLSLNAHARDQETSGANPSLYLTSSGAVSFKADATLGFQIDVTSPGTYRDGQWHHAVAAYTKSGSGLSATARLYVDGGFVGEDSGLALIDGTSSAAYWHLGWTDNTALGGSPVNRFTGDLSGAFVTTSAMTPAQVAALQSATSAAAYSAAVPSAEHVWMLGEDITSTFTGTVGFINGGNACAMVRLAWSLGATTAFTATQLSALPALGWRPATPAAAPGVGTSQTLTTSYSRANPYDTDTEGLELHAPLRHRLRWGTNWIAEFHWNRVVFLG